MSRYNGFDDDYYHDDYPGEDLYSDMVLCPRDKYATNRDVIIGHGKDDTNDGGEEEEMDEEEGDEEGGGGGEGGEYYTENFSKTQNVQNQAIATYQNIAADHASCIEDDILDEVDQESFLDDDEDDVEDDDDDEVSLEDHDSDDNDDASDAVSDDDEDDDNPSDSDDEEEEGGRHYHPLDFDLQNDRKYINDMLSITKQCMIGGPITSVLILPIINIIHSNTTEDVAASQYRHSHSHDHSNQFIEYDVFYGQGPYLHRVPHEDWIQRSLHRQQQQQQRPHETQRYSTSRSPTDTDQPPLLVFPEGGTIHGIREYGYDSMTNQHILLLFGGHQLTWIGFHRPLSHDRLSSRMHRMVVNVIDRIDTTHKEEEEEEEEDAMEQSTDLADDLSESEQLYEQFKIEVAKSHDQSYMEDAAQRHQKRLEELSKVKYHTEFDDWIWDCRIVATPTASSLVEEHCDTMNESDDNEESYCDDIVEQCQHNSLIIVGFAHQQIEVCYIQLKHQKTLEDVSMDESSILEVSLTRLHSIKNDTIPKCIAYSMNFWITPSFSPSKHVMIASGTVSNTICIWPFTLRAQSTPPSTKPSVSLHGHQGAIHAVRFHDSGYFLISTSDDRTVRLWEKTVNKSDKTNVPLQWNLKWTAYGHTARGWDVAFCDLSNLSATSSAASLSIESKNYLDGTVVLSTGEDGTLRVWDARHGHALAVLRGHSCQCIWRVATIESNRSGSPIGPCTCTGFTVSSGNDGTIAFYDIHNAIPSSWWDQQQSDRTNEDHDMSLTNDAQLDISSPDTFLLPNDFGLKNTTLDDPDNAITTDTADTTTPTAKRKKKDTRQTVIGMKFTKQRSFLVQNGATNVANGTGIIVATRSGSMWDLDVDAGTWTELEPWNYISHSNSTSDKDKLLSEGNCMCIHPHLPFVAIGTASGDIALIEMAIRKNMHGATMKRNSKRFSTVLPAHEHYNPIQRNFFNAPAAKHYRSVQSMKWIMPNILVSFHVHTIIIWYFPKLCTARNKQPSSNTEGIDNTVLHTAMNHFTSLPLRTYVKGLAISAALNAGQSMLVVGDTRGNLSMFNIATEIIEEAYNGYDDEESEREHETDMLPVSTCRACHQKEHITDIVWQDWKTVVSVGNDGKICKCTIGPDKALIKLLSIPVGSFTGISKIWKLSKNNQSTGSFIVGGYYGNNFAIVDAANGYEFFRVDTGGRQRAIDVWMDDDLNNELKFPHSLLVATCASRDDGCNEVQLHGESKVLKNNAPIYDRIISHSRGIQLHGESIFDTHIFPIDEKRKSFGILTGSEDCTARLTIYRGETAVVSTSLPPQVSAIRAIHSCRFNVSSTLVVIGGKNSVDLYLVEDIDDTMFDDVKIRYLGNSSPIEKLSIDHRINCVRAFVLKTDEDLDESEGGDSYQPIIVVVTGDSNGSCYEYQFIKSFTTSGKLVYKDERPILCLDIVPSASDYLLFVGGTAGDVAMIYLTLPVEPYDDSDPTLRLLIHAHSMGTNSISVRTLSSNYNNRVLRILSCGDDQSISCRDVTISSYGRVDARNAKCKVKNAALSALKGIHFIANNLVVVTGYDQKISLWRYISNKSLVKVHECATDIGDVNCFSICSIGGTHRCSQLLVVGGAGLEVLQLRIKQPKY